MISVTVSAPFLFVTAISPSCYRHVTLVSPPFCNLVTALATSIVHKRAICIISETATAPFLLVTAISPLCHSHLTLQVRWVGPQTSDLYNFRNSRCPISARHSHLTLMSQPSHPQGEMGKPISPQNSACHPSHLHKGYGHPYT